MRKIAANVCVSHGRVRRKRRLVGVLKRLQLLEQVGREGCVRARQLLCEAGSCLVAATAPAGAGVASCARIVTGESVTVRYDTPSGSRALSKTALSHTTPRPTSIRRPGVACLGPRGSRPVRRRPTRSSEPAPRRSQPRGRSSRAGSAACRAGSGCSGRRSVRS